MDILINVSFFITIAVISVIVFSLKNDLVELRKLDHFLTRTLSDDKVEREIFEKKLTNRVDRVESRLQRFIHEYNAKNRNSKNKD